MLEEIFVTGFYSIFLDLSTSMLNRKLLLSPIFTASLRVITADSKLFKPNKDVLFPTLD